MRCGWPRITDVGSFNYVRGKFIPKAEKNSHGIAKRFSSIVYIEIVGDAHGPVHKEQYTEEQHFKSLACLTNNKGTLFERISWNWNLRLQQISNRLKYIYRIYLKVISRCWREVATKHLSNFSISFIFFSLLFINWILLFVSGIQLEYLSMYELTMTNIIL